MNSEPHNYLWWRRHASERMAAIITQMGLRSCPVCSSESSLGLLPKPVLLADGGAFEDRTEGNILFMAVVRCESCGYTMLFDSEKFTGSDERDMFHGPRPLAE